MFVIQAQELRPSDSRMLVALGESYERLDKLQVSNFEPKN
jgi:hypothetical protein